MQDVTTLGFMQTISRHGPPDYFFTEFFRVHVSSKPEPHIVRSITENTTGRPIFAQLIGEDLDCLERTADALLELPVAGIDLNLGCPAPKVYKKNVGGGLLRDPEKVDQILGRLRATVVGLFTVKMRIGFEDTRHFETLLSLINHHRIDLLSLHGRTVKELYRPGVHYEAIAQAVSQVKCPVLANGDISSPAKAEAVLKQTGAAGVMIGRGAIRNPWIFAQIRQHFNGQPIQRPNLADVRTYIDRLAETVLTPDLPSAQSAGRLKKFLNFVGLGVDPNGAFLYAMRRCPTLELLMKTCDEHLLEDGRAERLFSEEPHPTLIARPNHEAETC
jgi:tRNA-dihydrouridine synthase B